MTIIFIIIGLIISLFGFMLLWSISPTLAFIVGVGVIAFFWYQIKKTKEELGGKNTTRTCPECGKLNQSKAHLQDWNCYNCQALIAVPNK